MVVTKGLAYHTTLMVTTDKSPSSKTYKVPRWTNKLVCLILVSVIFTGMALAYLHGTYG